MILALIASLQCGMVETAETALRGGWGETPAHVYGPWVTYANPATGTWTLLEVHGDVACLRGAGILQGEPT